MKVRSREREKMAGELFLRNLQANNRPMTEENFIG